jgi:putative addiction module component (TIGR02574 family)
MVVLTMSTEELLAQVLRLPRSDRARVTSELLSSLEEPEDVVARAWATELERRSVEVADGTVPLADWEDVRQGLLDDLKARRATRSSS